MTFATAGIHHVTAITSGQQRNLDFYAGVLGLRLVKRTVNFDDPTTYHFYFGDESGSPGSLITFFAWPGAKRGRPGAGQVGVMGAGAVHHVAFRARDESEQIAVRGPGFTLDEPLETLGLAFKLPPWLEDRRFEIEALLPDVRLPLKLPGPAG